MNNLDTLKEGYKNFSEGNIEAVLSMWDEKIVWHACAGLPYIEGDGIFIGPQAVLTNVLATIPAHFDDFSIEISDFIDGGDKIVMQGYYTGVWKETGKRFKANATHTWTFKNGKPCTFFQAVDSALIMNP
ncbi:nuclear transport factor 2 family protein [Draconibacterium sp. IB214405]|uniref:nuclear transport factor 2 family protein n=1 Tax=Draconibacterium sp. IB214405 TaxID=3097352 RepID=UPI002A0AF20C|nr:nuclear transport factor 2 family protein [Draconibacterium sp. IB214405]MDX8339485.1 nuclear transport factor 2 family protein [Draconibacterium sp. IB214405]